MHRVPCTAMIRTTLLLTSAALLASCAAGRDRAADSDTAAAPPVAQPDRSSIPAEPTLTMSEHGIGPLRIGMSLAEASAALGGALIVPPNADTAACDYVEWRGAPAGVTLMVDAGRLARVDVSLSGVRTANGIGVGDSEEAVQRAYGGRAVVSPHKYEDGYYLAVADPTDTLFALVFETSGGKVTRYRGGRRPQVEYVEGCS